MNLLFYVPIMASYGGMERHVLTLAEEAASRGHHVRFITTSNSLNDPSRQRLLAAGIVLRELSISRGDASRIQKLLWLLRETRTSKSSRHWDFIYTNGQSGLAASVWRAASVDTRIVHHHHTAADADEQETWAMSFRAVLRNASEVIACSQTTADNISAAISRPTAPLFLPYFTACPVEGSQIEERRPSTKLNFGFIGRLVATKGIHQLAALSERPELADIHWHIYGSGGDFPAEFFRKYPNITFHGPYRDQRHYSEILRSLDAIALYSQHNEGMPLSLIEAMSAGLPWIATDKGGTRELAHEPSNCEVIKDATDISALLTATRALADRILSGQTSRKKQRHVYDRFFAPSVVSKLWLDYIEQRALPPAAKNPARKPPAVRPWKILFVSHAYEPSVGGIESMSRILVEGFRTHGHEVRVITQTAAGLASNDPNVFRKPSRPELLELHEWCDIIFHSNISLRTVWPMFAFDRPWIVIHHTWLDHSSVDIERRVQLKKFALRYGSSIAVSPSIANALPVPAEVIPNCYDNARFRLLPEVPRTNSLIFVGRLVADKGVDLLLHALALLARENLTPDLKIIGTGNELDSLATLTRQLGLEKQVHFSGLITGHELCRELNAHKVLVVPSLWHEPFGIVALEAIASGCVVIGSQGGGLPQAIGPCGLTFPNGDIAALAASIRRILIDPALQQTLRAKAPEHLEKHSPTSVIRHYLDVIERIAPRSVT